MMSRPTNPIREIRLSVVQVPIATPVSDAKVATGRQKALAQCTLLVAEVLAADGSTGIGFSYALRTGGRALYAHAQEVVELLIGREADDIELLFDEAVWAGASVGRSGVTVQAIAAIDTALWDLRARRLNVPLSRLIGQRASSVPVYNTSRGYLNATIEEMLEGADASLASGIGGIKIKVGQPDWREDLRRVAHARSADGERTRAV
jgi:L-alanine-DL-glutamate epimerase-like enolase superfamily enzyme